MKNLFIKIHELLERYSSGKNVLLFFIITQIVYGTMLLFSIPRVMQYSNGMKILDLLPTGYSAAYVQKLFETLGETGRAAYLFRQLPLDMVYPALSAISYSLLLTFIFKIIFSKESKIQYLSVVPILGGMFDYLENIGIITMLSIYPNVKSWLANLTCVFSVLKSMSMVLFFTLLSIGMIILLIKKIQNRKSNQK